MKASAPSIVEFVTDPQLLGLSLSPTQEALLRAAYALPLRGDHLAIYRDCTGRETPPRSPSPEVTVIAGARSGKDSRVAAPIVCYEGLFGGHERHLSRGERAILPLVAQDLRATKVAFTYIRDYLTGSKLLARRVDEVQASSVTLANGLEIACFPCTQRSLRGWSIPAGVMDELAFYRLEGSATSDVEVQQSIRRGMVSFPATRLVKISTPYMRSGVLYDDFASAFGQENPDLLVWKATSLAMNPSLRAERLEEERRKDPTRYAREYEAEFTEDLASFLESAVVDEAVAPGRHELPPCPGVRYLGAVDTSSLRRDAFTFAVVHTEGHDESRRIVQDVIRGWGPGHHLDAVISEIATIAKAYRLTSVTGDKYAVEFVREAFQKAGVRYVESKTDKSEVYLSAEPFFTTGRVELLDHQPLVRELKRLERRPHAGGRTVVDHPDRSGHDDFANALCLAIAEAGRITTSVAGGIGGPTSVSRWTVGAGGMTWSDRFSNR